jgi:general secretion pathway protein C
MLDKPAEIINNIVNRMKNIIAHPASHLAVLQTLLIFAAITILSGQTVSLVYKLAGLSLINRPQAKNNPARQEDLNTGQRTALQSYGVIIERNLFLSTLKAAGEKQLDGGFFASGPEASTFELKGTVAGDTSFGFAIMEERGTNKQILRRLGDMVGQARLVKITRHTAVLRSAGREITLKIKETPDGSLFPRSSTSEAGSVSPNSLVLNRREITEKLSDLKTVLSQAMVRPYFSGGNQEGYIISDIKPESLYSKLGLQNGDIIVDVNYKRMQTADDVLQLVNLMQSGTPIAVNVKRNGKTETINYSFN